MTLALACLCAARALAADGVIEIDQARALAGGVTPGDGAGFPVTLSRPGSYRLTGNLTVSDPNTDGVVVRADGATLDLAGFQIQGPVVCTGSGATLSCGAGTGSGISGGRARIVVRDGRVRGFGFLGVSLGTEARVERVTAESNGGSGITTGERSVVTESIAYGNGSFGIQPGFYTVVTRCVAAANRGSGIFASEGSTVIGNTASQNGLQGVAAFSGAVVRANSARGNASHGIETALGSLVTSNAVLGNDGFGVVADEGSTVQRNAVRGNGGAGLSLQPSASYRENTITANPGGSVSGGVNLLDNSCNGATTCP